MEHCDYCGKQITTEPVTVEIERNICREGIEMDVPVLRYFCTDECKHDYFPSDYSDRTPGNWDWAFGEESDALGIFPSHVIDTGIQEPPICLISPRDKVNERDWANAKFIVKAANEYDKLKGDNAALLRALKICWDSLQTYGEHPLIKLTVQSAIQKAESK